MALDWNQLALQFGMGMVGQPNLAASIGGGGLNVGQNMQYQNLLQKLSAQPQMQATPNAANNQMSAPGQSPQPVNISGAQAGMSPGGMLAGADPRMLSLLQSLPAQQGQPLVSSLLSNAISPHGFDVVQEADGPHAIDKLTAKDLGRLGAAKPLEMDPTKRYYMPDGASPMPSLAGPPQTGGAPNANIPLAESVAPLLLKTDPRLKVTGMERTPQQNAAVGGVPNSAHLADHAIDFAATPGLTAATLQQEANALGLPDAKAIYEGPGAAHSTGPHFHLQWGTGGAQSAAPQASPLPGYHQIGNTQPIVRPMTPAELKQYNALPGSSINTITGAPERATAYNSPAAMDSSSLDGLAASYNLTGQLPAGMGRGGYAAQQVLQRANQLIPPEVQQAGPAAIAQWRANNVLAYGGKKAVTNKLAGTAAQTAVNEGTVNNSINILRNIMPKAASKGQFTDLNTFEQYLGRKTNDPNAANLKNAIDSISAEYARVMTGSTSGNASSDASRREAGERILLGYNQNTMDAVLSQMQQEMAGRSQSYANVLGQSTGGAYRGPTVPFSKPATATKVVHWNDL